MPEKKIWVYTPMGMLITTDVVANEQEWLNKGLVVAYVRMSPPVPVEVISVTPAD